MGQYTSPPEQDVATTRFPSMLAAGAGDHLPVGDYSTADYRSAMRFAVPAGWTGWTSIVSATLKVYISDHQHVAPKNSSIFCSRMAVPVWTKDQGTQDCESGFSAGNNTQYDDIQSVATDRISFSSGSSANAAKTLDVTAMVRYYWQNNSKLVFVFDNNGADQYTELWALGKAGTTYDAILTINYETASPPTAPTLVSPDPTGVNVPDVRPTFTWVHHDPQNDPQSNADIEVYQGATLLAAFQPAVGSNQFATCPVDLPRGVAIDWRVRTYDAVSGAGAWKGAQFAVLPLPVVTIKTARKMVFANGKPRLIVEWTYAHDVPQGSYQVTAPGYAGAMKNGTDQSVVLDTLDLTSGTAVPITVQVWDTRTTPLTASATRSFTPRYGLTTHRKTLAVAPVNWQPPVVVATVPPPDPVLGDAALVWEFGQSPNATDTTPTGGWFPSPSALPKPWTRFIHWRAWFIPNDVAGPVLDSVNLQYDSTVAALDKWGSAVWPWENPGALPAGWTVDTGEAVYGTRSLRCDVTSSHYIASNKVKVRKGRSYVLSGLMRSQGKSGALFRLVGVDPVVVYAQSPQMNTPSVLTDWDRYKSNVWVATADMDVYVMCLCESGTAGATAWFDGIKLEEAIVATPWNPASVGATALDAGGVQIDGTKGGLFRYKGTAGATDVRALVEGGANGLKFGGDTELFSPRAAALALPDGVDVFSSGAAAAGAGGGTTGYWWKAVSGSLNGQYQNVVCTATVMMTGMNGASLVAAALVHFNLYQANPLGSQPSAAVRVDPTGEWSPGDFKLVVTSATASATAWELWVRTPWPWFSILFKVQQWYSSSGGGIGGIVSGHGGALVAAASAGTAYVGTTWANGGATFPGVKATGDRFYRTDLNMEFYWDGTRWLSTTLYEQALPVVVAQASDIGDPQGRAPTPSLRGGSDIWLVSANLSGFKVNGGTALSASHKWAINFNGGGPGGIIGHTTFTVDSGLSNNVWRVGTPGPTNALNKVLGTSYNSYFYIHTGKTGTPGPIDVALSVLYRIIAT